MLDDRLPTATPAENQALLARMQYHCCVDAATGNIHAYFTPTKKLNDCPRGDEHLLLRDERHALQLAWMKSLGKQPYIHALAEPDNGMIVIEFKRDAAKAFTRFLAQHEAMGQGLPKRKGWLSRAVSSVMDGITEQACAERGCYPADWRGYVTTQTSPTPSKER